ncbi:unnamed protein product [Pocillopora meandrina]|uniref:Hemicentin-1 n=1 Tax=Pocillopora meandrina TaxID=46732 RepID=A0AAU9VZR7_9CNID|nr:unnamed protein product [Pocillopora meandrina]
MNVVFAISVVSTLLICQADITLSQCDQADWSVSLDRATWSTCPNSMTYLKGMWRNDRHPGDERVGRIEYGRCCRATEPTYVHKPSTCSNANWLHTLDRTHVWALCPNGYYMQGMRLGAGPPAYLHHIDEAKCCHPQGHPNSYEHCYDQDVTYSFDNKGWSECQQVGYYMTGFYKSDCNDIYCIEKFRCCKMKKAAVNGGWSSFGPWGQCSATCGGGTQERSRTCTNPPPSGGGAQCVGPSKETQACNTHECPVNGGWSDWGDWGQCSASCGDGQHARSRTCTNPPPSGGGAQCSGDSQETRTCNNGPCNAKYFTISVDGGWSNWSNYGECSKSCGKGKKYKYRTCTNPPQSGDGKDCDGRARKGKKCREASCKGTINPSISF